MIPTFHGRGDAGIPDPVRTPTRLHKSDGVVLHCTGGVRPETPEVVRERIAITYTTHVKGFGWSDAGYSFLVDPFGEIWTLRGWGRMTAATKTRGIGRSSLNTRTHSIVVQGDGTELTDAEETAIRWIINEHDTRYGVGFVIGHRDVSSKSCPGPEVYRRIVVGLARPMGATS